MQSVRSRMVVGTAGLALLSGCAVSRPPVVAVPIHPSALPPVVRLDATGDVTGKLATALTPHLAARGMRIGDDARHTLTVAASEHDAEMGVAIAGEGVVASPRKHRWYDACRARRLTATLMVRGTDAPAPEALARGTVDACAIGPAQIEQLATALAASI